MMTPGQWANQRPLAVLAAQPRKGDPLDPHTMAQPETYREKHLSTPSFIQQALPAFLPYPGPALVLSLRYLELVQDIQAEC